MKKIPTTSDEFQEGDNLYPSLHISCSEILYYGIRMANTLQKKLKLCKHYEDF